MEREEGEGSPCKKKIDEKMKKKNKAKLKKLVSDYVIEGGAFDSFSLDKQCHKEAREDEESCLSEAGIESHHTKIKKIKNQKDSETNDENKTILAVGTQDQNSNLSSSSSSSDSESSSSDSDSDDSSSDVSSNKSSCKRKRISSGSRNSCNSSNI